MAQPDLKLSETVGHRCRLHSRRCRRRPRSSWSRARGVACAARRTARTPVPTELTRKSSRGAWGPRAVRQPSRSPNRSPPSRASFLTTRLRPGTYCACACSAAVACSAVARMRARGARGRSGRAPRRAPARAPSFRAAGRGTRAGCARAAVRGVRRGAARALAQLAATSVARLISASSMASARGWRSSTRTRLYVGSAGRWFFGCGSERRCNFFA